MDRRKKKKSFPVIDRRLIIMAVIAVVAAAVIYFLNSGLGASGKVISYGADSKTAFRTYGNEALMYTKDGAVYYGNSWEAKWTDSYYIAAPIALERGEYTALYETDGRNIRVYDKNGLVNSIQTSDTIVRVALAENGYVGVISGGSTYMVSVYNTSGKLIFQRVEVDTGVYPVCCAISPDGKIIAISYMDTTGVEVESKIGMFYIDADMGAEYADSMFSAIKKEDEIVFENFFMSERSLITVSDRNICAISSAGTESASSEVTNEITGVGLCSGKVVLVYGDELPDKEGTEQGTVVFAGANGSLAYGDSIGSEPDYFYCSEKGIVLGSGTDYYGIGKTGAIEWKINAGLGVTNIYPASNINKCIYVSRTWSVLDDMRSFEVAEYDGSQTVQEASEAEEFSDDTEDVTEETEE